MNKQVPDILSDQAQSHLNRTILKLAWPAILEQFLICMASLADTAMVGSIVLLPLPQWLSTFPASGSSMALSHP